MDLEECVFITDSTLFHLAMGCPRLEYLVYLLIRQLLFFFLFLIHFFLKITEFVSLRADHRRGH